MALTRASPGATFSPIVERVEGLPDSVSDASDHGFDRADGRASAGAPTAVVATSGGCEEKVSRAVRQPRPLTRTAFLASVIDSYTEQGITIPRVITDNGAGYGSPPFRALLAIHGIRHIYT